MEPDYVNNTKMIFQISELREIARGSGIAGLPGSTAGAHQPQREATTGDGRTNPERPDTSDSNSSANILEYSEWDAHSTMTNFTQSLFNLETDSSEEDDNAESDSNSNMNMNMGMRMPGSYPGLTVLNALYNAATHREAGTSTQDAAEQDAAYQRARDRARRPAFKIPRNVSPDTREFYRSIGLSCGESDFTQNCFNDFISMDNPRTMVTATGMKFKFKV